MSATSAPMPVVAGEEPEVRVEARGLRVVVAGADVDVVAHAVALAADDEQRLGVRLHAREAVDDVHAGLLQRFAQWMFACSSKRAFSSTMQTACLPRSAARISDGTSGESSRVR